MASISSSASLTCCLSKPPKTSSKIFPNNFTPSMVSSFSSSALLFQKLHSSSYKKSQHQYWSSPIRASTENPLRAPIRAITADRIAIVHVRVINADNENPAEIYGCITCRTGIESDTVLFDRKQKQYIKVRPGDYLPLTEPEVRVHSTASLLEITAYLMDYDVISADDEVANDTARFLVKDPGESDTIRVFGKYGTIEITVQWTSASHAYMHGHAK